MSLRLIIIKNYVPPISPSHHPLTPMWDMMTKVFSILNQYQIIHQHHPPTDTYTLVLWVKLYLSWIIISKSDHTKPGSITKSLAIGETITFHAHAPLIHASFTIKVYHNFFPAWGYISYIDVLIYLGIIECCTHIGLAWIAVIQENSINNVPHWVRKGP